MSRQFRKFCLILPITRPQSLTLTLSKQRNYMWMTKSEIQDKQICLLSIIFEVANCRDKLWKTVRWNSFKNPNFYLLQSSSVLPIRESAVSVVLFWPAFNVLSGYFYVSLGFDGYFVIPNLAEFRDTAPLPLKVTSPKVKDNFHGGKELNLY